MNALLLCHVYSCTQKRALRTCGPASRKKLVKPVEKAMGILPLCHSMLHYTSNGYAQSSFSFLMPLISRLSHYWADILKSGLCLSNVNRPAMKGITITT